MALFPAEEMPLLSPQAVGELEGVFAQKPMRLRQEVPIVFPAFPQPRNDLPLVIISAITIISLVGLFLAFFTTRRSS